MPMGLLRRSALVVVGLVGCGRDHATKVARTDEVAVVDRVKLDGELDEPAWNASARIHVFTDRGAEARPYSNVRFLHDAQHLYLGLYAADQDIRSGEQYRVTIGDRELAIDPRGHVTPASEDVRAAVDIDGTIDNPADEDEEWVIELAVPLPATPFALRASRCDTPKDGIERCGSWVAPEALSLAP